MTQTPRSDFIPSTEQVRAHYVFNDHPDVWVPERGTAFDRWIAELEASVLRREALSGLYGTAAQSRLLERAEKRAAS